MLPKTTFNIRLVIFILLIASVLGIVQFFNSHPLQVHAIIENPASLSPFGASYAVLHEMPIPSQIYNPEQTIYDPVHNRLYVRFTFNDIVVFDLDTGETIPLENVFDIMLQIAVSADGNNLYIFGDYNPRIDVLETNDYSLVTSYESPRGGLKSNLVADSNGRLYSVSHEAIFIDRIDVWESDSGTMLESLSISDESSRYHIAISPDNTTLYLASSTLRKFDISSSPIVEIQSVSLSDQVNSLNVSGDDEFITLALDNNDLVVYDTQTLTQIHYIPHQLGVRLIDADADIDGNQFWGLYGNYGILPTVSAWEASSGDMLRKYIDSPPWKSSYGIASIGEGRIAIVLEDSVKVLTPTYYGVALPIIMNDYCTAPIIDDFSNPNSGWPVGKSGSITYQYLNGEYNLLFTDNNLWTAITRGLVWDNSKQIEVKGRLATSQDGVWGLLYGLDDNWTSFYTFEILPSDQIWVVFHYTSASGWQVVANGTSSAIQTGTATNRLRITKNQSDSSAVLYINDVPVHTDWSGIPTGRIGITGGSFMENTDLRYDDFLFVDENCPMPTQIDNINGEGLTPLVIQERPSFDSLLPNITNN